MKVLITCSGIGKRMGVYTEYTNKALIKIGDKFTIDYIIDLYKHINNVEFIITLGYYGDFVKQYLEITYTNLKFTFVNVDIFDGPNSSLIYSLKCTQNYLQEPFIYITCDTIILDNLNYDNDYNIKENKLFVYKYDNSINYASVKCNNNKITNIYHKNQKIYDYIYIGNSEIYDIKTFWNTLNIIYNNNINNHYNLGDVDIYINMIENNNIFKYYTVNKYFDGGNINVFNSELNKNKQYNVLTKYNESISFHNNIVVKFFHNKQKNLKRVNRTKYLNNTNVNILRYSDNFHVLEKINSKPLSEYLEINIIYKLLIWASINLWITTEKPTNFNNILYDFYYNKTMKRISMFLNNKQLIDYTIINNINIGPINNLINRIDFNKLCNAEPYNFHGDFILDNILLQNNKFILIDWREEFGNNQECGDKYYDLAKLKHNIYLNHNNLENNLFKINVINDNTCNVELKCNYNLIYQLNDYNKFIKENNLDAQKINILMSLIWINMAPLHEEPLSSFLFNFGKYNLYLYLNNDNM